MSGFAPNASTVITNRQDLRDYFLAGCKPRTAWLIGTEHEKFPFRLSTLKPVRYDEPKGMRDLLHVLKVFGWRDIMEGEHIIGLRRGGASIALEPGGQVKLSGAPVTTLHETAAEIDQHLDELREVSSLLDLGFLGLGFHPTALPEDLDWVPKGRYAHMRTILSQQGGHGLDMMRRTCSVQVNLDYADEADMVRKLRVAMAMQPIATALFAASPFTEGQPNGFRSYRMHIWRDTDPGRCGLLPFVFADDFGFDRYIDYALALPLYFVVRNGVYLDAGGQSFTDFMAGKLAALPGERPTLADWHTHLTTLFPDVRLHPYLELRGADCGTAESILALPSFWAGLLYDSMACDDAWAMVKDWAVEDLLDLHRNAPRHGLKYMFRGREVRDIAHEAVKLAQQGLRRRAARLHGGADETRYLDGLFMMTESGDSLADDLLMRFEHQWHGTVTPVFRECQL